MLDASRWAPSSVLCATPPFLDQHYPGCVLFLAHGRLSRGRAHSQGETPLTPVPGRCADHSWSRGQVQGPLGVAKNACPLGAAALSQGRGRRASASPAGQGVKNQEDGPQKGQLLPLTGLCLSFREVVRHYGERDTRRGQVGRRLQRLPVPGWEGGLLQGRHSLATLVLGPCGPLPGAS